MTLTLIQMTIIMSCGLIWRYISPEGLTVSQTRQVITTVVYYVFLPALVLNVLWGAEIGLQSIEYSILGVSSVLTLLLMSWIVARLFRFNQKQMGAVMLAASFPNVIYLGLPVLEQTFGGWARSVAVQINFFAVSPLVYTVGVLVARHYGMQGGKQQHILSFLKTPPFCAVFIAIFLNIKQLTMPVWFSGALQQLSAAVIPLMIFSLGMSLSWTTFRIQNLPFLMLATVFKLVLMPLFAVTVTLFLTIKGEHKVAAILEMAMPSMLVGIILCDQYKLDNELYAMAVTVTTVLSLLTLPYWYQIL